MEDRGEKMTSGVTCEKCGLLTKNTAGRCYTPSTTMCIYCGSHEGLRTYND